MANRNWFTRQPVGIRAALITAVSAIIVGLLIFISSMINVKGPSNLAKSELKVNVNTRNVVSLAPRFEQYDAEPVEANKVRKVSLIAFTLDPRHAALQFEHTPNSDFEFQLTGYAWPVLLAVFYNGTEEPVVFTGVEVIHGGTHSAQLRGVAIEPFAAVDVHIGSGFQQFTPPLMLPPKEAGAIRLRLKEDPRVLKIPYGIYQLKFQVAKAIIESPRFRWRQR